MKQLSTLVHSRNRTVMIDTRNTFDNGLETMVFPIVDGSADFCKELDVDTYETEEEAQIGHDNMVKKWRLM